VKRPRVRRSASPFASAWPQVTDFRCLFARVAARFGPIDRKSLPAGLTRWRLKPTSFPGAAPRRPGDVPPPPPHARLLLGLTRRHWLLLDGFVALRPADAVQRRRG